MSNFDAWSSFSVYGDLLSKRETRSLCPGSFARAHFPKHYAHHLGLSKVLTGHTGCVNRLAWNQDGSLLASGSDDRKIMLWNYPDKEALPICINTQHVLNIFGVQFLPGSNNSKIVTCALDRKVELHTLERPPQASHKKGLLTPAATSGVRQVDCHTVQFSNHSECVKDVVVEENNSYCFWTAGDDGRVHQFDTRCPLHISPDAHNMLIKAPTVEGTGAQVTFKALDMSKTRPYLMAAACSDQFIRIYDRRMFSLRPPTCSAATPALLSLAPLHLLLNCAHGSPYTTCARFSNRGDKVIGNYHGDQAYTFDIRSAEAPPIMDYTCYMPDLRALVSATLKEKVTLRCEAWHEVPVTGASAKLRHDANQAVYNDHWHAALRLFDKLLQINPWFAPGYVTRSLVLLRRGWKGDAVSALRDADTGVALDPHWSKPYGMRIMCLHALKQIDTALRELELFREEFPEQSATKKFDNLEQSFHYMKAKHAKSRKMQRMYQRNGARRHRFGPPAWTDEALPRARMLRTTTSEIHRGQRGARPHRDTTEIPDYMMNPDSRTTLSADGSQPASQDPRVSTVSTHPSHRPSASGASNPSPGTSAHGQSSGRRFRPSLRNSWESWFQRRASDWTAAGERSSRESHGTSHPGTLETGDPGGTSGARHTLDVITEAMGTGVDARGVDAGDCPSDRFRVGQGRERGEDSGTEETESDSDDDDEDEVCSYLYGHVPWDVAPSKGLEACVSHSMRMLQRYAGHKHTRTVIKEATFIGSDDAVVACGSDCGRVCLYDALTGELLNVVDADQDISNCVQCHPKLPTLATSGLEHVVKLWEVDLDAVGQSHDELCHVARENQRDLNSLPFLASFVRDPAFASRWQAQVSADPGTGRDPPQECAIS